MRVCSVHGCPNLYPEGEGTRCAHHRRQARRQRTDNAVYNTKEHLAFRAAVLARDPVCTDCRAALSTIADHFPLTRRELVTQNLDPNDPKHGRGLCTTCHNSHTARTTPGGWAAARPLR